jgi:plastocyanin
MGVGVVAAVAAAAAAGHVTGMRMETHVHRTVVIPMRELRFEAEELTVRDGETVRLVFDNRDDVPHEAVIARSAKRRGPHDHASHGATAVAIAPGAAAELIYTFGSEPVTITCHPHAAAGMTLELTPVAGSPRA